MKFALMLYAVIDRGPTPRGVGGLKFKTMCVEQARDIVPPLAGWVD